MAADAPQAMDVEKPAAALASRQDAKPAGAAAGKADGSAQPNEGSVRQYLDSTVVPVLMAGLSDLVRTKPADPCEHLAQYLISHNPQKKSKP